MTTNPPGRPKAGRPKAGRPKAGGATRDLRTRLLRTSRELLDEGGPSALSMREVARRAGCTHQAPYHYFENREAILAELVAEGFAELGERLREAHDLSETDGVACAAEASANAYVGFALTNPGVFRIMFRPDMCDPTAFPGVGEASDRARGELARLTRIVHGDGATPERETIFWSHAHGLACLLVDGPMASEPATSQERLAYARRVNGLAVSSLLRG